MCTRVIADIRNKYGTIQSTDSQSIQKAVELLLSQVGLSSPAEPLPVVKLLQELGFTLYRATFKDRYQSGLIAVDSSLPEKNPVFKTDRAVLVNQEDSTAHQRFTIAHEIAHYIFDFDESTQPVYYKAYNTKEQEDEAELRANRFAAELLMPTSAFVDAFDKIKKEQGEIFSLSTTITKLANQFDVPATAVQRRIQETGCNKLMN